MKTIEWFWSVVEFALWYAFFYYLLDAINNPTNLSFSALVLTVIGILDILVYPWFRNTTAWKKMMKKKVE